jgi:hypothetical protein
MTKTELFFTLLIGIPAVLQILLVLFVAAGVL